MRCPRLTNLHLLSRLPRIRTRVRVVLDARYYHAPNQETRDRLIGLLARNPELNEDDAGDELRWMMQALRPNLGARSNHDAGGGGRPTDRNGGISGLGRPAFDHAVKNDPSELERMVERRAQGEPLQYILKSTDFGPLTLACRAPTLIPRPETAFIFTTLAELIRPHLQDRTRDEVGGPGDLINIVDLCTGSAPIPLLLSHLLSGDAQIRIHGYELQKEAVELAKHNIDRIGATNVTVHQGDIFGQGFAPRVLRDLGDGAQGARMIVSNPPYIPYSAWSQLPSSVKRFEDPAALLGDRHTPSQQGRGLDFYRRIAELLPQLLDQAPWDGPRVALEIGSEQGGDVRDILATAGLTRVEVFKDQHENDRMVVGWA